MTVSPSPAPRQMIGRPGSPLRLIAESALVDAMMEQQQATGPGRGLGGLQTAKRIGGRSRAAASGCPPGRARRATCGGSCGAAGSASVRASRNFSTEPGPTGDCPLSDSFSRSSYSVSGVSPKMLPANSHASAGTRTRLSPCSSLLPPFSTRNRSMPCRHACCSRRPEGDLHAAMLVVVALHDPVDAEAV